MKVDTKIEELNDNQINLLIDIDKGNKRNELILKVLYNTGIRVSELISLNKEDITNWKDGELIIMGKGAKKKKIKLG